MIRALSKLFRHLDNRQQSTRCERCLGQATGTEYHSHISIISRRSGSRKSVFPVFTNTQLDICNADAQIRQTGGIDATSGRERWSKL